MRHGSQQRLLKSPSKEKQRARRRTRGAELIARGFPAALGHERAGLICYLAKLSDPKARSALVRSAGCRPASRRRLSWCHSVSRSHREERSGSRAMTLAPQQRRTNGMSPAARECRWPEHEISMASERRSVNSYGSLREKSELEAAPYCRWAGSARTARWCATSQQMCACVAASDNDALAACSNAIRSLAK
ncbi:hypothetical protein ACVIHI_000224 [Bradyrhizobium sp. USDA 4524]|nr:hypothetical protein [Bradyrhizobium sp. USDA 4538]MCP1898971.1 hypothetical protein [Bradyrhizobium sp. USDA 4537]MCP1909466.1 hypothetical protein [Bradyrhizobium elkanii]MCP1986915.1 hypothetical protein [Bradyrhizobium sp. USDA 4539]